MRSSTLTSAGGLPVAGGGFPNPIPRTAQITVTHRLGDQVTVATWSTCHGVADFISSVLGEPGVRVQTGPEPA